MYLRSFCVFFIDVLIDVNLTSLPNCWGSRAGAVRLGLPIVFWKAKDLIQNVSEGRQVYRPSRSYKWPWPREATIFCVLPRKIAVDEWDKVVINFRLKYLSVLVF